MAVASIGEVWAGRRYNDNLKFIQEYVRVFQVFTDTKTDGPDTVLSAPGMPQLYDSYTNASGTEVNVAALVKYREPLQDNDDPTKWLVRVQYTTNIDEILQANPLLRPAKVSRKTERFTRPIFQDANGAAIVNSAGQPFSPPPEVEDFRLVIEVQKNFLALDDFNLSNNFLYRTNSVTFLGFPPNTLWLADYSATQTIEYPTVYDACTFSFHANPLTWTLFILDQGYYYVDGSNNLRRVQDPFTAQPLSAPALLNGSGAQLAHGGTPVFLSFTKFFSADFNSLAIFP
jgi:hypothetical protein